MIFKRHKCEIDLWNEREDKKKRLWKDRKENRRNIANVISSRDPHTHNQNHIPFVQSANISLQLYMYQRIYPEPEREFALDNELNQIKNAKDKALPPNNNKNLEPKCWRQEHKNQTKIRLKVCRWWLTSSSASSTVFFSSNDITNKNVHINTGSTVNCSVIAFDSEYRMPGFGQIIFAVRIQTYIAGPIRMPPYTLNLVGNTSLLAKITD